MSRKHFKRLFSVYDFGADYNVAAVDDILDIHTYLMKKNDIKSLDLFEKGFVAAMLFFCYNVLKCVLAMFYFFVAMCWSKIITINSNESLSHSYSVKINKCSDSCNSINDP